VLGNAGLDDLGGTDIDAVAVHLAGSHLGDGAAGTWRRLQRPAAPADLRDRMVLWADVRTAKEMLSRAASAPVPIPGVATGTILTRAELEHAVTPLLARGVEQAATLIDRARIGTAAHRVFLVGGGSRMPLVAQLLHRRLGISPTVTEQPEIAVAAGAALAAAGPAAVTVTERLAATPPAVQAAFPADSVAPGAADDPVPDSRNRRRRRRVVAVIAAVALLAGAVLAWQLLRPPPDDPGDPGGSGAAGTSPASAPPSFDPTSKPAEFTDNAALRAFVQGFDAHLWLDGCRSVADGDPYRIDGRYHNPRAVAPAGAPVEQIHCRSGDFEAHFVRYPRRIDADRVVRAYTVEVTALPRPPEARFGPYDNLWPLPSWGDDQHALLWSDLEQFLVGIMSTSRATTDLQLLWTKYAQ
jgi:hypothetical protein